MSSNMVRRVAFAVVAIPVLVGVVWLGAWPLVALLVAAATLGIDELFQLSERAGVKPFRNLGRFLAGIVPLALLAMAKLPADSWLFDSWGYAVLLSVLLVITVGVFARTPEQRPLASIAVTLFGVLYTSVLPSTLFVLRHALWGPRSWAGTALVFFPLIVTWVCDSAAMLGGQMIGGAKMAPIISPGKTRAGGIAGLVGGTAIGAAYAIVVFPRVGIELNVLSASMLALALSAIGQVGDLAESLFKREAGVKDSSALIPGHGGVLDRLDSLYFVIPAAAAGFHLLGVI